MKKFIYKARLLIRLWTISQQIRTSEILLDQIEKDIASARSMVDLLKEFVTRPQILTKVQKLEQEKVAHVETLRIYKRQFVSLNRELVS